MGENEKVYIEDFKEKVRREKQKVFSDITREEILERILVCCELKEIQGLTGNFDSDTYMLGMYNGMELLMSILEGRLPEFRSIIPEIREGNKEATEKYTEEIELNKMSQKKTISGRIK